MKVLEKGTGQHGWAKEFTCTGRGNGGGGCGAKLLVEQPDLYQTSRCDYTGDCDYFTTFKCAECGVETDIDGVPAMIVSDLPSKRDWLKRQAAADPIEEAQQKSQPTYPSRF